MASDTDRSCVSVYAVFTSRAIRVPLPAPMGAGACNSVPWYSAADACLNSLYLTNFNIQITSNRPHHQAPRKDMLLSSKHSLRADFSFCQSVRLLLSFGCSVFLFHVRSPFVMASSFCPLIFGTTRVFSRSSRQRMVGDVVKWGWVMTSHKTWGCALDFPQTLKPASG